MKRFLIPALVTSICALAIPAFAHISLQEPTARYDGSLSGQSKACPCGVGESNRFCDVPGDRSDPDRSANVTELTAGSTVTLRWDEYIAHSGRYRVAFDPDGADMADFNANILLDVPDPSGNQGNIGQGSIWELEVTVPDTPCDNCTLQLIQMMDGNTTDPVSDPVGRSTYYQCADIVIVAPGGDSGMPPDMGSDGGAPADMGGGPGPDMGGPGPGPDTGGPDGTDSGTNPPGPDSGAGADGGGNPQNIEATGGCACGSTTAAPASPLFLLLGLLLLRRRRIH